MMKKRLLCALLLLALALSLLPTVALADDAYTAGTAEELQSLLGQRKTPIKLTDNINLKGQPLTISGGNITIDMAGYTIFGGTLIVEVSDTRPLTLNGGGTINCPAELNGTINGDAAFLQDVVLIPNDECTIHGGSFFGKVTQKSTYGGTNVINGGTFYGEVDLIGAYDTKIQGGVFYKKLSTAGNNGTPNIFAGMFFDTSVASQFADDTVSMDVIFDANGGTPETVTAKAVAYSEFGYSALIAPPNPLPTKDGYVLTGWYTDSVGGTAFDFDQKWTVDMIEAQQDRTITLYARWEKAPEEPEETDSFPALAAGALLLAGSDNPFRDVRAIDWFYDDVMYAYDRGLITGTAYGKFSPRDSFTRGMLLTILARHDGVHTKGTPWYQAGCDWAAKNGISDGKNPEEAISREEFALILYRYAQYLGKQAIERADLSRYTDAGAVSETALPAVQWAAAEAILRGDNFRLNPQDGATRAEAAAMLHRFFTR